MKKLLITPEEYTEILKKEERYQLREGDKYFSHRRVSPPISGSFYICREIDKLIRAGKTYTINEDVE